jgi:hypothetical protein
LRDYCRTHHVSYGAFSRWASTHETACGLLKAKRANKRSKKTGSVVSCSGESVPLLSNKPDTPEKPLLYPLHIIPDSSTVRVTPLIKPSNLSYVVPRSVERQSLLRGISVTFPNGIKVSIREASGRGLYCLVHGSEL